MRKNSVASSIASPVTPTTASSSAFKNQVRSAKTDGIDKDIVGNSTRNKCIELLYDALASDSGARTFIYCDIHSIYSLIRSKCLTANDLILSRAKSIEVIVFQDFQMSIDKPYRDKMRSLYLNIKDKNNPSLRESIVSGELAPSKLTKMTSQVCLSFNCSFS